MKHRIIRLVGTAAALSLTVAACGSDDNAASFESTDDAQSEGAANDTAPDDTTTNDNASNDGEVTEGSICGLGNGEVASGDPIPIGAISGETGADDFSSSSDAATAYFDCVNENGGINGRPIDYIVEDDQWNPEVAGQAAAKLVNDESVIALVGGASFVECGVNADLYAAEGVTSLAGVGVPRQCFESTNIVTTNEGPRLSTIGVAQYAAAELGSTSMVCIALAIPGLGDWSCGGVEEWGAEAGVDVTTQLIDPALPDPTAVVLAAMAEDPDLVVVSAPAGAAIAILAAAEQQDAGANTVWSGPTSLYDIDLPAAVGPYWNDNLFVQIELDVLDSEGADNQQWRQVMDQYASDDDPRDSFSQAGFLAAKIFTEAMLGMDDPATIDRATASEALGALVVESDLTCGPWYYALGESHHNPNHAGRIVKMTGDAWEPLTDCVEVEDGALEPVLAYEEANGIS